MKKQLYEIIKGNVSLENNPIASFLVLRDLMLAEVNIDPKKWINSAVVFNFPDKTFGKIETQAQSVYRVINGLDVTITGECLDIKLILNSPLAVDPCRGHNGYLIPFNPPILRFSFNEDERFSPLLKIELIPDSPDYNKMRNKDTIEIFDCILINLTLNKKFSTSAQY